MHYTILSGTCQAKSYTGDKLIFGRKNFGHIDAKNFSDDLDTIACGGYAPVDYVVEMLAGNVLVFADSL